MPENFDYDYRELGSKPKDELTDSDIRGIVLTLDIDELLSVLESAKENSNDFILGMIAATALLNSRKLKQRMMTSRRLDGRIIKRSAELSSAYCKEAEDYTNLYKSVFPGDEPPQN